MPLTNTDLKIFANEKAADARLLLEHGRFSNAYYLGGYAIELGLKAVIAKRFRSDEIPDKNLVDRIYTHKLTDLVIHAELKDALAVARLRPEFDASWNILEKWKTDDRYRRVPEAEARALIFAVDEDANGVLPWIRQRW